MKKTKYRAWSKYLKEMIYFEDTIPPEYRLYELNIMMFTGVIDSKGHNIYDGDIINSFQNDYEPTEVFFDDDILTFCTQNYHSCLSLKDSIDKEILVLGNIYQNKDLLK